MPTRETRRGRKAKEVLNGYTSLTIEDATLLTRDLQLMTRKSAEMDYARRMDQLESDRHTVHKEHSDSVADSLQRCASTTDRVPYSSKRSTCSRSSHNLLASDGENNSENNGDGDNLMSQCASEYISITVSAPLMEVIGDIPANTPFEQLPDPLRDVHAKLNELCGFRHAVRVLLGQETHPNLAKHIYEAGVLFCVATFIQEARREHRLRRILNYFSPARQVQLCDFSSHLNQYMRHASVVVVGIPSQLHNDYLPPDSLSYWNDHPKDVVTAIDTIDMSYTGVAFKSRRGKLTVPDKRDVHTTALQYLLSHSLTSKNLRISQMKAAHCNWMLACAICKGEATRDDACNPCATRRLLAMI